MPRKKPRFNFAIAKVWPDTNGQLSAYTVMSSQVFWGTIDEAKVMAAQFSKETKETFKVYRLVEYLEIKE